MYKKISKFELIVGAVLPIFSFSFFYSTIDLYLSKTTLAEKFERNIKESTGVNIPNESHVTGVVIELYSDTILFHPIVGAIVFLLLTGLYLTLLIKYRKQDDTIE